MDIVKKSLAFGLGAAVLSAEKLKQMADEMVARGEMTSDEAKSFVDEMSTKAEEEKSKVQEWMRDQMHKMLQHSGAAEASRVADLERRVATLELRVAELEGEPCVFEEPEASEPAASETQPEGSG